MRKIFSSVIAISLVLVMMLSLSGCNSNKSEIKTLMSTFESACNTLDFDAVIGCIEPKRADKIRVATDVIGMFTDADNNEMFRKLASIISIGDIDAVDFFSSIKIDVEDVNVEDTTATVNASVTYDFNGKTSTVKATIDCVNSSEKWYISDFSKA